MDQPFIGVIFAHAGNFAPRDWALCAGQPTAISQNETLYTLLGTIYGGDGQQTFNLPDLRGRVPIGQGQGLGLNNYVIGQASGSESVTITTAQIPSHNHFVNVVNTAGTLTVPTSASYVAGAFSAGTAQTFYSTGTPGATLLPATIANAGGSVPMSIIQPILTTLYIISLYGIFPSRN
jgi:microcystin-dependent protein